jgi:HAMP domain-containing protein
MERSMCRHTRFLPLKTKAILLLVPFAIGTVSITGFLSILSARVALTRGATRILAYKAEQIRDFAHSQLDLLEELGLQDDLLYIQTAKSAIQSYAGSTLRSSDELVFALDRFGRVEIATSPIDVDDPEALIAAVRDQGGGWIEFRAGDGTRVAQTFVFEPFGWTIFASDLRRTFFAEIVGITRLMVIIAAAAACIGVLIALWFAAIVGTPVAIVSSAMSHIRESGDLGRSIPVLSNDEIGMLAGEFNRMSDRLAHTYHELELTAESERRAKQATLEREYESLIVLAKTTEYKDMETGHHLYRVGEMSRLLAELIGLETGQQELLFRAGPLHDVGKIGIADTVLLKPGPLDAAERRAMETHAEIGFRILSQARSRFLKLGAIIARTHHEKWDGSGYPRGIAGTRIPLFGRIVGIVDVLDALTSERSYKHAWSLDESFAEIERTSGSHFDPALAEALLDRRERFADIIEQTPD